MWKHQSPIFMVSYSGAKIWVILNDWWPFQSNPASPSPKALVEQRVEKQNIYSRLFLLPELKSPSVERVPNLERGNEEVKFTLNLTDWACNYQEVTAWWSFKLKSWNLLCFFAFVSMLFQTLCFFRNSSSLKWEASIFGMCRTWENGCSSDNLSLALADSFAFNFVPILLKREKVLLIREMFKNM